MSGFWSNGTIIINELSRLANVIFVSGQIFGTPLKVDSF